MELGKGLGKTIASISVFALCAAYRIVRVVICPLALFGACAWTAMALADSSLAYLATGGLTSLGALILYVTVLFVLVTLIVACLAVCHLPNVAVGEAFQAMSYQLPNFLMLLYATSIILATCSGLTGMGPFRFGKLSIALTILIVALFALLVRRTKKPSSQEPEGTAGEEGSIPLDGESPLS